MELKELLRHKPEIRFVLLSFTDLLGVARSKLVPREAALAMAGSGEGAGFAGYAAHLDLSPAEPDVMALPDPRADAFQLPWNRDLAWVPCDLFLRGQPLAQSPRQVLKEQVARAAQRGLVVKTGVEAEFYLLHSSELRPGDARDRSAKPCYDQSALTRPGARTLRVVTALCDHMRELGWGPYQADHEDGNGQLEINWGYADCVATADRHAFFKFMCKAVAESVGLRATFMPKPFLERTGNGAHCHVSVWDEQGRNLFLDDGDQLGLAPVGYCFMGGVLAHAKGLAGLTNPSVNSYKRINTTGGGSSSGSSWAPCSVSWTGNNRTHMIRVPGPGRFELRLPDGAANPYLLQAGIVACGLEGVEKGLDPGPRCDWNGHGPAPEGHPFVEQLPTSLLDAMRELEDSIVLSETLGEQFVGAYVRLQRQQWNSYAAHLSSWELENTLDC